MGFGFSLIIWVLTNGYPSEVQIVGGIFALVEAFVIVQVVISSTFLWKNRNDVANTLMSVYGLGRLAYGAYQVSQSKDTDSPWKQDGVDLASPAAAVCLP